MDMLIIFTSYMNELLFKEITEEDLELAVRVMAKG
jgi:hypothetical protein